MGWTAPRTWATGETVTSANMNTHVRDNENWIANDHPRCWVNRTAVQSIPDVTDTAVAFSAADTFDVGSMHDIVTNNTRIVAPTGGGGLFKVSAWVQWAANGAGTRSLYIRTNGSSIVWRERRINVNVVHMSAIDGWAVLAATEYLELLANQNSTAALNIEEAHMVVAWWSF